MKILSEILKFPDKDNFDESYSEVELICKWGCDESSGYRNACKLLKITLTYVQRRHKITSMRLLFTEDSVNNKKNIPCRNYRRPHTKRTHILLVSSN